MAQTSTATVSMLPAGTVQTTGTGGGMRMVMVSSAGGPASSIGKPITITVPGAGTGGMPKTVTITGKTSLPPGSQILPPGTTQVSRFNLSLKN